VELVEASMSSPIYELLKRPDELFVVEHAHLQPRFVEDSVRVAGGGGGGRGPPPPHPSSQAAAIAGVAATAIQIASSRRARLVRGPAGC
jgi:hypothetical protein